MISGVVEKTVDASLRQQKPRGEDFISEGLLYCGRCKTPRQARVFLLGAERTVGVMCNCEKEREKARIEEEKEQEKRIRADRYRSLFPDRNMAEWTFEKDDGKSPVSGIARRFCTNFPEMLKDGKGLLFFGPVGTGKTFMATCIANELIDRGYSVYVTNFSRIANKVFELQDKQAFIDGLNEFQLLVVDDLAAERKTEYMMDVVWNVIDTRIRAKLPMIITTNLSSDELKNGDLARRRIFSRLYEACLFVEVSGRDRREQKMKADYRKFQNILKGDEDGSQQLPIRD